MLYGLWVHRLNRAEYRPTPRDRREFMERAEQEEGRGARLHRPPHGRGVANAMGEFAAARPHCERGDGSLRPERHGPLAWRYVHDLGVARLATIAASRSGMPAPDRALAPQRARGARRSPTRAPATPTRRATRCGTAARCRRSVGATSGSFGVSPSGFEPYARSTACRTGRRSACASKGRALAATGQRRRGHRPDPGGHQDLRGDPQPGLPPGLPGGTGRGTASAGRWEEAEQTIETALHGSEQTGERWMDAELWRLKGQVAPSMPAPAGTSRGALPAGGGMRRAPRRPDRCTCGR